MLVGIKPISDYRGIPDYAGSTVCMKILILRERETILLVFSKILVLTHSNQILILEDAKFLSTLS